MADLFVLSGKTTDTTQIKRHLGTPKHMSYKNGTHKSSNTTRSKKLNSVQRINIGKSHESGRSTICWIYTIAQMGINFTQGNKVLWFFETVGQDCAVFYGMRMSRRKISNIVINVLSPYEKEKYVKSLQNCKLSLHIDELTESVQRKKWMTLQIWYVHVGIIDVRTKPLSLLSLDWLTHLRRKII